MTDKNSTRYPTESKYNGFTDHSDIMPCNESEYYEIEIKGHLEEHWSDWLGGLRIQHEKHGNSLLSGNIPDQAALHGILAHIRDLGLTLISLNQIDDGENG